MSRKIATGTEIFPLRRDELMGRRAARDYREDNLIEP